MNLYKCLGENEIGEPQKELIRSCADVEELKLLGRRLCEEQGIEESFWIKSVDSWQELSSNSEVYFIIRP